MDAELSTHTFLTMIIEEYVCFMSCEPIFFCNYSYVVHTEYIFFFHLLNIAHERWSHRKISNLGSRVYHLHYCTGKQNYLLSNILRFIGSKLFFTRSWSAIIGTKQPKVNHSPQQWRGRWTCTRICRFLVVWNIFRLETCMNNLGKVPLYSKLNVQGKFSSPKTGVISL
jgi:hypothetical protein